MMKDIKCILDQVSPTGLQTKKRFIGADIWVVGILELGRLLKGSTLQVRSETQVELDWQARQWRMTTELV